MKSDSGNTQGTCSHPNVKSVRVYAPTAAALEVHDPGWNRTVRIEKSGSLATAVWNPWIEINREMPDYGDEEYREMVCIESANTLDDARLLPPGIPHMLSQKIGIRRYLQDK